MYVSQYYYTNVLKQDLLTKFHYENSLQIPALKKVVLSFGVSQSTLRHLLPSLSALLLISFQKPSMLPSKKPNLRLKVKGGVAIGCKVVLRGKEKFFFFEKLVLYLLPRLKNFQYTITDRDLFFKIDNLFLFKELEKEYDYFQDLPTLNVNLNFRAQNSLEIRNLLAALKFPATY